jgi:hypothetical protein
MCSVASGNRQETRSSRPGFVRFCYRPLAGCVMHYVIIKTIVTSIAAATIALAAPAHADNSKTVCPSMGNGITHAQENCPQAPRHDEAPGTYNGYVLPNGYGGKA